MTLPPSIAAWHWQKCMTKWSCRAKGKMDISCVILSWNSEHYIAKCVSALVADLAQHRLAYEIFVVDNGSHDQTVSMLKALQAQHPDRIFPMYA